MATTTVTPAAVVPAPTRTPLPYGLFSVLDLRPEGDGRWQSGAQWESLDCDPLNGVGAASCDPDEPTLGMPKTLDGGNLISDASPFGVYGDFTCSPVGWTPSEAQDRATEHLTLREEQRVEQALWTGDLGNEPNLVGAGDSPDPGIIMEGAPQTVLEGLAYLEYVIATEYGSQGVIHMTRGMALIGIARKALETRGGRLVTRLGTPVVAGSGYDGSGPEGTPALTGGQSWAYATPALLGYRSSIFTSSSRSGDLLDRGTNDMTAIAERTYLIGWDDCGGHAAVLLDSTYSSGSGGGGTGGLTQADLDAQTATLSEQADTNQTAVMGAMNQQVFAIADGFSQQTETLQGNIDDASTATQSAVNSHTDTAISNASADIQANDDANTTTITDAISGGGA